jgi:hypothetical protein
MSKGDVRFVLGWQESDQVRCDPESPTSKIRGAAAGHYRPLVDGAPVERLRWTTTLSTDALEVLRTLSGVHRISRNEVVERLLASPWAAALISPAAPDPEEPADVVVSTRVPASLAVSLDAYSEAIGTTRSQALRSILATCLP